MSSLSVHLRLTEDHSGLPFHPSCPVCRRDRLAGSLSGDELVSRRTRAAVAAGLLAFSGVGAPVAVAQGPDQEVEGSTEVVGDGEPESVDLGGASGLLPDAEPLVADDEDMAAVSEQEDAALEGVAVEEGEAPVVGAAEEPVPDPTPAPEPVALAAPPAEAPAPTSRAEQEPVEELRVDGGTTTRERVRRAQPVQHRVVVAPAPAVAPAVPAGAPAAPAVPAGAPAEVATPVVVATAPTEVAAAAPVVQVVAGAGRASAGERFHVVRRGESLWSIAADVLGERAGVARVAREVNRLWALNEDRIASGSPDLLYAGTRLRLR